MKRFDRIYVPRTSVTRGQGFADLIGTNVVVAIDSAANRKGNRLLVIP